MVTAAGGGGANEDRVGHHGSIAWVIDGATDLYTEPCLPAGSDVEWLVDVLDAQLAEAGTAGYRGSAATLLENVAARISQRQAEHGLPADRLPPACSVALLVDRGSTYEIARIGDATAFVYGAEEAVLTTDFFDNRERNAVGQARDDDSDGEQIRARMLQRRSQTMTSADLESVFSGHPRRTLRAHTISGEWRDVAHILMCTDGFARLVTDYDFHGHWRAVVDDARAHGLAYLAKLIREIEAGPAHGSRLRFKRSDDLAALLAGPDGS